MADEVPPELLDAYKTAIVVAKHKLDHAGEDPNEDLATYVLNELRTYGTKAECQELIVRLATFAELEGEYQILDTEIASGVLAEVDTAENRKKVRALNSCWRIIHDPVALLAIFDARDTLRKAMKKEDTVVIPGFVVHDDGEAITITAQGNDKKRTLVVWNVLGSLEVWYHSFLTCTIGSMIGILVHTARMLRD